jgi:hypothetical protein
MKVSDITVLIQIITQSGFSHPHRTFLKLDISMEGLGIFSLNADETADGSSLIPMKPTKTLPAIIVWAGSCLSPIARLGIPVITLAIPMQTIGSSMEMQPILLLVSKGIFIETDLVLVLLVDLDLTHQMQLWGAPSLFARQYLVVQQCSCLLLTL